MRILTFIFFAAVASLCYGDTPESPAPITKQERAAIEAVIKRATTQKILVVRRVTPDTVEIFTGSVRGPLSGSGQSFTLKQTKKGWEIQRRGNWDS